MKFNFRNSGRFLFLVVIIILGSLFFIQKPSNDRIWSSDQKILSHAVISNSSIEIFNIRNITYENITHYDISYYNKTIYLNELKRVDYIIEELEGFPGFAHTMLSFGFEDNSFITISVEIRKEENETYNPFLGMFRKYELMFVIADERDVINLRTNHRNDILYLYPINISKESLDKLFISMIQKTNDLKENPEFYNTLTSTCTSNLAELASENTFESFFKFHPQILLPKYSDNLLLKKNLIQTNLTQIKDVRNYFNINTRAKLFQNSSNFSLEIRNFQ